MIQRFGAFLRQAGLSRDNQIALFACLKDDGSTELTGFNPPPDTVAAYRRTAQSLGIHSEPAVMDILNAWASAG